MSLFEDVSTLFAAAITDGQDNEAIVKAAYEDLLGYADADTMNNSAARIDYWVQKLSSGELTTDNFGGSFLEEANTNQGSLISSTTFENNQTVVAAHEDAYEANPDVTLEDLTAVAAENRVEDVAEEDEGVTGETFTLTTSVEEVDGTPGDDTFRGVTSATADETTFQGGDVINGLGGTDRLDLTLEVDSSAAATMENVEQVYARNVDEDNAVTVDATSFTGVDQFWNDRGLNNVTFDSVGELATVGVKDTDANTTITFLNSVLSGDEDSVTVALDGAEADGGDISVGSDGDDGVETIVLSSGGDAANEIGTIADGGEGDFDTLNVVGAQDLEINGTSDSVETVSAADFEGALTADLTAAGDEQDITVTGSAQDDSLTFGDLDDDDSVDGGEGEDSVTAASVAGTTLTGIAALTLEQAANTVTLDLEEAPDITSVTVENEAADLNELDITELQDDTTITLSSDADVDINQASTLQVGDGTGSGALTLATAGNGAFEFTNTIDTGELDELTLDLTNTGVTGTPNGVEFSVNDLFDRGADDTIETITITGDAASAAINNELVDSDSFDTLDASGFSGVLDIAALDEVNNAATGIDIRGGSGNDDIFGNNGEDDELSGNGGNDEIDGGTGEDTISGGAGNDIITGGAGADELTGGAGVDQFRYANNDGGDTITDFAEGAGGDAIRLSNGDFDIAAGDVGALEEAGPGAFTAAQIGDDEAAVLTGAGSIIDTSGNDAADLAAINAAFDSNAGDDGFAADADAILAFVADTDGDGNGDEVQVWFAEETGSAAGDADAAQQIATLSDITVTGTTNLAGEFDVANFGGF